MIGVVSGFFLTLWCLLIVTVAGFAVQQGLRRDSQTQRRKPNLVSVCFLGTIALLMVIIILPGAITGQNVYTFQTQAMNLQSSIGSN